MNERPFTSSRGRRFALTLGFAFAVLSLIAFWRDRRTTSQAFGVLAAMMFLGGLLIPEKLGPVERVWMSLAHAISRVTTPIFMGIVYFVILTPVGIVRRIAGANSLVHQAANGSYWIRRPESDVEKARRQMERQF